jgi:type I restriction enzyme S subunit
MKWPTYSLSQIAIDLQPGFARQPGTGDRGFPQLRTNNVSPEGRIDLTLVKEVPASTSEFERYSLQKGDILFNNTNSADLVGKTALFDRDEGPYLFSNHMTRIRVNHEVVDPRFVALYLFWTWKTGGFRTIITRWVNQAAINRTMLGGVNVPLPPLSEQRQIVEILDQADALRKKRAEADTEAARILPALFYNMFGDPAKNPKGWSVVLIGELVEPIERRDPSAQPEEPFIYIDIAGVNGELGVITDAKTLIAAEAPSRARQIIKANDVIVSTVRPYLRATALVPVQYDNQICSTGFCVLRRKTGIGFGFLYTLSRLQWFTDQLNARARGASYPAVTDADIFNLSVPHPNDHDALKRLDRQVLDVLVLQDKRRAVAGRIDNLFETLLHRAFAGDLTIKWREAHMKELLQEMEQQNKTLEGGSPRSNTNARVL